MTTSHASKLVTLALAGLALFVAQGCGGAPGDPTGQSAEAVTSCSATQAKLSQSDPFEADLIALSCLDGSKWAMSTNGDVTQCPTAKTITTYCPATGLQETVDAQGLATCYAATNDAQSSTSPSICGLTLLSGYAWVQWFPAGGGTTPNCSGSRCWK